MNLDEFAFVNQQLAGMLKSGIPLEGALRRLCTEMRRGDLRSELEALERDLVRGTPLRQALAARRLPSFYVQMIEIGAQSNDLPAVLSLLADYYGRVHVAWTRLKGLLVYPLMVLGASFAVSVLLAVVYRALLAECSSALGDFVGPGSPQMPASFWLGLNLWLPVTLIGSLCVVAVLAVTVPTWRRSLRWRFPAFRESSLSQLAAALALLLERGCPLDRSLGLVQQLEAGSPMGPEIAQWQTRLAAGHKGFSDLAAGGKVVPPLFVWLVAGSGEDWAGGFKQAATVYYERAIHQVEVLLYAALPVSVLALGLVILVQVLPMLRLFAGLMRDLSMWAATERPSWIHNTVDEETSVIEELMPRLIAGLAILTVALAPFLILYTGWWRLNGLRRAQERANSFLTLLEIGLNQGRTAEQTFLSIAHQHASDLGARWEAFVAHLRNGRRLGTALDAVPQLLPPAVRSMIKAGEELGDYRPVLSACRATLKDGAARSHSVFNSLVVLLFVSPVGPLLIAFMAIWIFPKLQEIAKDMDAGNLNWSMAWFEASVLLAKIITTVWVALWVVDWLRRPDSWLNRVTAPVLASPLDRFSFHVPWLRKRMQRDFSTMLALLLDGGVPEEKALRLAAESTANRAFIARAGRAREDLRHGVKLTEAVQRLDRAGEFRWRLSNAAGPGRGFGAALAGWHEALGAKAFQQEQAASQVITTGFVCLNGAMVGLVGLGFFHLLVAIMEEASW